MRLVPVFDPLPRRTALVPELPDEVDVDVDPPLRDVALDPDEDEPLDEDPELLEPEELEDDPLDGGADRTGCCSEYDGAEYTGADTAAAGGDDSRGIACVALGLGAGGSAVSVAGGADRGMA